MDKFGNGQICQQKDGQARPGPVITKWLDALPQALAKFRRREIWVKSCSITLKLLAPACHILYRYYNVNIQPQGFTIS